MPTIACTSIPLYAFVFKDRRRKFLSSVSREQILPFFLPEGVQCPLPNLRVYE